jgi:hypothetical protein
MQLPVNKRPPHFNSVGTQVPYTGTVDSGTIGNDTKGTGTMSVLVSFHDDVFSNSNKKVGVEKVRQVEK